ncbi:hypothetical protein B484DRAFT_423271 [Ochromonadaceae sp. CCMP2298]|nr:hypothetical protein B484DRAFT_423271 [Ochromonadaceae sp. CCMP2298]
MERLDEGSLQELSKAKGALRSELLFTKVIKKSKSRSILNAYHVKREITGRRVLPPQNVRIGSSDAIYVLPEGKYNHTAAARIPAGGRMELKQSSPTKSRTCLSDPTMVVFDRLNSIETFPTGYKRHHELHPLSQFQLDGDFTDAHNKTVCKILRGTSQHEMAKGRAADVMGEVNWRMMLRSGD